MVKTNKKTLSCYLESGEKDKVLRAGKLIGLSQSGLIRMAVLEKCNSIMKSMGVNSQIA